MPNEFRASQMLHDPEHLTGYLERPSYRPGDRLHAKVSSREAGSARLVRLRHGDTNPDGPGLLQDVVTEVSTVEFASGRQALRAGSWGWFAVPEPREVSSFTVSMWIWPTSGGQRCAIECGDAAGRFAVLLDDDRVGVAPAASTGSIRYGDVRLRRRCWQLMTVSFDLRAKVAGIAIVDGDGVVQSEVALDPDVESVRLAEVSIAARVGDDGLTSKHFNGKIEAPGIWPGVRPAGDVHTTKAAPLVALDLGVDQTGVTFTDTVSGATGELFNMPTRGVTGHRWRGQTHAWKDDATLYGAVHFHDDDLSDADWSTTFTVDLPPALESGFYAIWMLAGDYEDWITFVVTRSPGRPAKPLLVLVPTLTYLAYANEPIFHPHLPLSHDARDDWNETHGHVSQYNWHSDGSGVTHASWRRPMTNLRPDYRYWLTGHPHGPGADLYLLHWLDSVAMEYDLVTDHELHADGAAALEDYAVLVTGCHPEYWTVTMLEALHHFEEHGGRVAYLGGNGLAAVVAVHTEHWWVSEMRRREGSAGLWDSDPGEGYFAADGTLGGATRHHSLRGRELVGVDITGMGFCDAQPYLRHSDSANPRVAFLFEDVDDDVIGDFGLHMGGAAGYEVDSADRRTGTPPHALVVATCDSIPAHYVKTEQRGTARADLVFFETASGGAVFAASSITWTGSLSHAGGQNPVAAITRNLLLRFLDPAPFEYARTLKGSEIP